MARSVLTPASPTVPNPTARSRILDRASPMPVSAKVRRRAAITATLLVLPASTGTTVRRVAATGPIAVRARSSARATIAAVRSVHIRREKVAKNAPTPRVVIAAMRALRRVSPTRIRRQAAIHAERRGREERPYPRAAKAVKSDLHAAWRGIPQGRRSSARRPALYRSSTRWRPPRTEIRRRQEIFARRAGSRPAQELWRPAGSRQGFWHRSRRVQAMAEARCELAGSCRTQFASAPRGRKKF